MIIDEQSLIITNGCQSVTFNVKHAAWQNYVIVMHAILGDSSKTVYIHKLTLNEPSKSV